MQLEHIVDNSVISHSVTVSFNSQLNVYTVLLFKQTCIIT